MENVLFDCLVAYRMILTPEISGEVLGQYLRDKDNRLTNL
jgi:hypothetical protein